MRDTAFRCCIWHRFSCAWWRRLCARAISGLLHAPVLRASRWFFARAAYCVRIGRSLLLGLPLSGKLSSKCTLVFFGWQDIAEMHDFEQAWGAFAFAVVLFSQLAVLEKRGACVSPCFCRLRAGVRLPGRIKPRGGGGGVAAASARTSTSARGARCISHVGCARHAPCTPISARAARIARRLCRARRPRSTRCAHHARRPRSTRRVCGAHIARRF